MARTFHVLPQIDLNLQNVCIYRLSTPPRTGQAGIISRIHSISSRTSPYLEMKEIPASSLVRRRQALSSRPRSEGTTESALDHSSYSCFTSRAEKTSSIVIYPCGEEELQPSDLTEDKPDSQPSQLPATCTCYLYRLIYI